MCIFIQCISFTFSPCCSCVLGLCLFDSAYIVLYILTGLIYTIFLLPLSLTYCFFALLPGQILQKEQEIKELKQKIAEVMAVMPSITYSAETNNMTPVTPHYSSKFMDTSPSSLDPNASVYQPLKK